MTAAVPRCADLSEDRLEPLLATASRVERWLLVEHRGSWDQQAPPLSRVSVDATRHLSGLARDGGARLLVVRRPVKVSSPGRWVFAVDSRPGRERILQRHVDHDGELASLQPPFDPGADGWTPRPERLWLVCTHGRHDLCCAVRGRPVARAMLEADPGSVWEVSHIGGDRFAPNVVLLPEGHYFGRVRPERAPALMAGVASGLLDVTVWRGRSSLPLPVQAAQSFARTATGRPGWDDLALLSQEPAGPDQWTVVLTGGVEVVVRYVRDGALARLTCGAAEDRVAGHFRLVSLRDGA